MLLRTGGKLESMKLNDLGSSIITKERNTPNELGFSLEIFQVAISCILQYPFESNPQNMLHGSPLDI